MAKTPALTDIEVGQRIRAARLAAGMTQEKLGHALGLTFQQIQKYEKGTNRVGPSRMVVIAETLHTTVPALFGYNDDRSPAVVSMMATRDGHALAEAFNQITSAEDRRTLQHLAERFAMVSVITAAEFGIQAAE